ncbi:glutaminyl-peptide cyclotransferase [Maribacter sp. 2307ULW6-5]|uniref:glutaminyl-peptide cyclotransferase n=1 Tax=Maribacter sp. 2307ULW6-5 TaxID=3386275 RepID=UPI0039BCB7C8
MRSIKNACWSLAMLALAGCGSGHQKASSLFQITLDPNKSAFNKNDQVGVSINNAKGLDIEKVEYRMDGKVLPVVDGAIALSPTKLGNKLLKATITYEGDTATVTKKIKVLSNAAPEIFTYDIVNEFPHDNRAYTQGLEFHGDTLYEGTGKNGRSFLRKYNFGTGEVYAQIDLADQYFGEGITILDNKIYQLTWRSGLGFVYDLGTLEKRNNFQYGASKEGWGLANDGKVLYKSDGTERIWLLDPETLTEKTFIETVTNTSIFNQANELEYVNGKLYANVYQKPSVMIIDAQSGAIEAVVNFSGLSEWVTKTPNWIETDNVLNGIAYHPGRKTFFVTGKEWDKLFEVRLRKK